MLSDLKSLEGVLIGAAATSLVASLYTLWNVRTKHYEIKHVFISNIAVTAFYIVACESVQHGRLIPLPDVDFMATPIRDVEASIRTLSSASNLISTVIFATGMVLYYISGLTTERGLLKMDEAIGARSVNLGEKDSNHPFGHRSAVRIRVRVCSLIGLLPILVAFVLLWPSSWLLTFSHKIYDFGGFMLASDHILWSILAFTVSKTIFTFIKFISQPMYSISSGVHMWTNFCWLYGSGLLVIVGVLWILAQDVLMSFVYKATVLIQTQQTLDSIVVDGMSQSFNVMTGPMADILLSDVFSLRTPYGEALNELLHEQLSVYQKVVDDSLWIVLLWVAVLFPLFKGSVMYYTWRTKMTAHL